MDSDSLLHAAQPPRCLPFAFFTLVGCHGLHVTAELGWLVVMMAQVEVRGFAQTSGVGCFALFWHTLDIVWVWLFTVVYPKGVRP